MVDKLSSEPTSARISRRAACKLTVAAAAVAAGRNLIGQPSPLLSQNRSQQVAPNFMTKKLHVAVIGAGAFGGWTALYLLRNGARVTLVDAWGPGNSRASSGGETRVIRGAYGPKQPYTKLAARALQLWKENQSQWKQKFFFPIGVLWLVENSTVEGSDNFERGSLPMLKDAGIPFEQLSTAEMSRRWPQINFDKIEWGIYEQQSGYLLARSSAQAVVDQFIAEGGEYRQAAVALDIEANWIAREKKNELPLQDGSTLSADRYVFACGPWLGKLFPQTVGPHFTATKQDVFFFGNPANDHRYNEENIPVWADHSDHFMYGIPGNQGRGFKLADDTRGPTFDPTNGERIVSQDRLAEARRYLAWRFPGMKDAPLVETRVCQYEDTTDHNFIIDRHPQNQNVWIIGGGSGHGFKHGPALGEMVTQLVLKDESADHVYRLERFS